MQARQTAAVRMREAGNHTQAPAGQAGNPFFIEESIRTLGKRGALRGARRFRLTRPVDGEDADGDVSGPIPRDITV
jgi:hypothetical protein